MLKLGTSHRLRVDRVDGEERGGDEAGGEAEAEDGDTDGVELEDDPEVEAEVGQMEHRGGETGQCHAQPDEYDERES